MPRTRTDDHPTTHVPILSRTGPARKWTTVLALAVWLALTGMLSSCGQEREAGAAPLGERAENDVPLNPPTLRFHVSADGQVDASPDLGAEAGEAVAIVLENEAAVGYQLRLLDPDGGDVFAVEASPEGRGDGRAMPREVGTHVVEVHPTGRPEAAEEFEVEVSDT